MRTVLMLLVLGSSVARAQAPTEREVSLVVQAAFDSVESVLGRNHISLASSQVVVDRRDIARVVQRFFDPRLFTVSLPAVPGKGWFDYASLAACERASVGVTCRQPGLAYFHLSHLRLAGPDSLLAVGWAEIPVEPMAGGQFSHRRAVVRNFRAVFVRRTTEWRMSGLETWDH